MANDKDVVTKTNDGYVVELFAKETVDNNMLHMVEGISILEEENKCCSEDEQYFYYKDIVDKMDYKPIIVKIPEIGDDVKTLKTRLRAILRSAKEGDVSIIFSKIATVDQLKQGKEILEKCKKELDVENIPYRKHMKIGVVVEIPSAALMSYVLAKECDFLFIDINSLTSYTFGEKCENVKKIKLYEKFQTGVIKLVQQAIEGAHDAGVFCGVCGDVVENNLYMPVLIGLGVDQFSIKCDNIINTRKMISELDKSECKSLVEEILQLRTIEDIEHKIRQYTKN